MPQQQSNNSNGSTSEDATPQKKSKLRKLFWCIQWFINLCVLGVLLIIFTPAGKWAEDKLVSVDKLGKADYILVLGGDFDRTVEAARLYRDGWAPKIIVTSNGTNADDLGDFRPGLDAARDFTVRSPLVEAGLTKAEIRTLSQQIDLPTWDKPAQACLASRIPYGTTVTVEALTQIAKAERGLRQAGFKQLRVRHHDDVARIEVPVEDLALMIDDDTRQTIVKKIREAGYLYVTLDLAGFRSGSLNEAIGKSVAPMTFESNGGRS